jgi:prepilin-type N-terminal cleavage/methylation domain-containing protein
MKRASREQGFTLVELVFGVTIMAIMVAAVGGLFMDNLKTVTLGKARAIGLALANEKMEYLRSLPYDALATQNGTIYPPGSIADNETVVRGSYTFLVNNRIEYVDDPYDGYASCPCASGPAAGKPRDLYPYDYKKAHIIIKLKTSNQVVAELSTDVAAKAAETSSNTGILSIKVLDASGNPIPNATVTITNPSPNPAVNISTTTDVDGLVVVPRLPPYSNNTYVVTVTKSGYSTDGTIADPPGSQTAVKLNPNVLTQQITSLTMSIDQLSTLYVHAIDTDGVAKASFPITITGAKKTKNNPTVYKYSQSSTTTAGGDITVANMEWDDYSFSVGAGYYVVSSAPMAPASLAPNSSTSVNLVISDDSTWPTIAKVNPTSGQTGTASSSVTVTGTNLSSAAMKLQLTGQSDINGTGCSSTSTSLTCNVNLTGAATGDWSLVVTKSGKTATQTGGYHVVP